MSTLDEFELIARYFAPLAAAPGAFGLRDDAATLALAAGETAVVTTDALVAGVHFLPDDAPGGIARRALRVNLSDLAAMGARPLAYALVALLPPGTSAAWLAAFAAGLEADQAEFGVHLIGGDTVATPGPLTLALTAFGAAPEGRVLRRSGAAAGEDVYVTGTIGDAALGLALVQGRLDLAEERLREYLINRYRRPTPRVELGPALLGLATAAIDLSDGLVADLGHVCAASGVGAEIRLARVPLSEAARALTDDQSFLLTLLGRGDDYELAFTVPARAAAAIDALGREHGVPVTRIGRTTDGEGVAVRDDKGRVLDLPDGGYKHTWQQQEGPGQHGAGGA